MAEETRECSRCHRLLPLRFFHGRSFCNRCNNLQSRYKTTYHEVKRLWESQDGGCALCAAPLSVEADNEDKEFAAHVDHCHSTSEIRGLLCRHCNLLLGHAKDRIVVLQAAIEYLRKDAEQD
jgi:hypothetical protein